MGTGRRHLQGIRVGARLLVVGLALEACSTTGTGTGHPATGPSIPVTPTTTTTAPPGLGTLLVEPDDGYGPVDAFIAGAGRSVDMTMYELADPGAEAALVADAARGVDVRVLLDRAGAGTVANGPAYARLAAGGVHVAWSYPGELFHQKTITVDDAISLVMTGNLTSAYYPTTRDFGLFDADPADVAAIESTFDADFAGASPAPAPAGSDLLWSPGSEAALVDLIGSAHATVTVESEEMDSEPVEAALAADAGRGVVVDVVMTASSSWDSAFDRLEAAGVHVLVYQGEAPLYVHAKVVVVDAALADRQAFVGSQNFSAASLRYDRELGVVTSDPAVVDGLAATLAEDAHGGAPWS
jgi:phosphatidylserine/phosphatidylglycerophosphate/cardiolipin synthase-like enzyme